MDDLLLLQSLGLLRSAAAADPWRAWCAAVRALGDTSVCNAVCMLALACQGMG
jgi:hypothetical protein